MILITLLLAYLPRNIMKHNRKIYLIALATIAASAFAYATNDSLVVAKAAIPLSQAISIAEEHAHGKASKAEISQSKKSGLIYEVEVVRDANAFDVVVDANNGKVLASKEDQVDRKDGQDNDDDGDESN